MSARAKVWAQVLAFVLLATAAQAAAFSVAANPFLQGLALVALLEGLLRVFGVGSVLRRTAPARVQVATS